MQQSKAGGVNLNSCRACTVIGLSDLSVGCRRGGCDDCRLRRPYNMKMSYFGRKSASIVTKYLQVFGSTRAN